ncbi:MAG TPA: adenosylcobinamide-GDP ribazoletransferase [Rubrobacter sp.]|nr:adenosylcobinamide-GDP ribazoletransferase [Rubrobacter sp.]
MRALLSFFTVLPVRTASLDAAARAVYLLPLVGLFTGLIGALLALLAYFLPASVAAVLALGGALLAAGFHHADGVLDVGDALMVRGDTERRRAVLKDARVGIGGLGAIFLVYAPAATALASIANSSPLLAASTLLAAEIAARSVMLLMLAFGRPAEPGSSSVPFVAALSGPNRTPGIGIALLAPLPFLLPAGAIALPVVLCVPLTALLGLTVSGRAFGGVGGDSIGATGELSRTVLLVLVSATL